MLRDIVFLGDFVDNILQDLRAASFESVCTFGNGHGLNERKRSAGCGGFSVCRWGKCCSGRHVGDGETVLYEEMFWMEELLQMGKRLRCAISADIYVAASILFTHAGEPFIKGFGCSIEARAIHHNRRRV
jgi:hypothetical protein